MYMYYVYPGYEDSYAFMAVDDNAAFLRILDVYKPEELACEEGLADAAIIFLPISKLAKEFQY